MGREMDAGRFGGGGKRIKVVVCSDPHPHPPVIACPVDSLPNQYELLSHKWLQMDATAASAPPQGSETRPQEVRALPLPPGSGILLVHLGSCVNHRCVPLTTSGLLTSAGSSSSSSSSVIRTV